MRRTILPFCLLIAVVLLRPTIGTAQVINFKGKIIGLDVINSIDVISQYLAINDTFTGSVAFNSATVGTPISPLNDIGTWNQYDAPWTGAFSLRFTSGASLGYSVKDAYSGGGSIVLANGILSGDNGPYVDIASGLLGVGGANPVFRPGLQQHSLQFGLWDYDGADLLDSAELSEWVPSVDASVQQSNDLRFVATAPSSGGAPYQTARFVFTEFALADPGNSTPGAASVGGAAGTTASLLGGASGSTAGGMDIAFANGAGAVGTVEAEYSTPGLEEFLGEYLETPGFAFVNLFSDAPNVQFWEVDYSEELAPGELITLTFKYDDADLTMPESELGIYHFGKYGEGGEREWQWIEGEVDTLNNTITITVDNLSPFVLGTHAVPEPSSFVLAAFAALALFHLRRR